MITKKNWNGVSDKERRRIANAMFIPHGFTDELFATMKELREGASEGAEAMCLIVVGKKGVGKSAFLKDYAAHNKPVEIVEDNVLIRTKPVIYVSFPPSPKLKGAAEEFARAIGGDDAIRGTRMALTHGTKADLKDFRTEMVIADEFQNVREEGQRGKSEVANWLKDIVRETGIPFVLAGLPETTEIIEADDQLYDLTEEPTVITAYDWDDTPSKTAWCALLANIDKQLPFNHRSDLALPETARPLWQCTMGYLRPLRAMLRIAVARHYEQSPAPHLG